MPKQLSRPKRWAAAASKALDALQELEEVQQEYTDWLSNMPDNLLDSPLGQKLQEVSNIDLDSAKTAIEEAENIDLPRGFGKD